MSSEGKGLLTYNKILMTGREQKTRLTVTPVEHLHLRNMFRCHNRIIYFSICNISHRSCHPSKWLLGSNLSPRDLVHPALLLRYRCLIPDPAVKYRMIYESQALLQLNRVFLMWAKSDSGIIIPLIMGSIPLDKGF